MNNSIHFANEYGEDIFNIPAPYMFDSADFHENNYDIKVDIQEYEKGFLLNFIPDNNWIQSNERVYPVMIDPEIKIGHYNHEWHTNDHNNDDGTPYNK